MIFPEALRICFVAEHYPPTDGGVATSAQRLARTLASLGAHVQLFCFDASRPVTAGDYLIEEEDMGVRVFRVGPFFSKQPRKADPLSEKQRATLRRRAFEQIVGVLREEPPHLVLSFYLLNAGYLGQFVARNFQVPHVAGVRGNDIGRNIFNVERFGVIHWLAQSAARLVCVNEYLRDKLLLAFPESLSRVRVVVNTTALALQPTEAVGRCRAKVVKFTGWPEDDLRLVFIGTLREKKGLGTLLLSLQDLYARGVRARLLVVGPEPTASELKTCGKLWRNLLARRSIAFTGWIDRAEVARWAAGGDAVVMPSLDDGMANGLLEGMALGLCPIASEVFREIITHERDGLIVPRGDAPALSEAVRRLCIDRALLAQLGRAAGEAAASRTPQDEAGAYLEIFRETLAADRPEVPA